MGFLREVELGAGFPAFATFRECLGYVPSLYRCQTLLPMVVQAEAGLAAAILFHDSALSRLQKERVLLSLAAANGNTYCATAHYQMLCLLGEPEERLDQLLSDYRHADLPAADMALADFAIKLVVNGPAISRTDVAELTGQGLTNDVLLETVLIAAWASLMCCLSAGVGASPDFAPVPIPPGDAFVTRRPRPDHSADQAGPYLEAPELRPVQFAPFRVQLQAHLSHCTTCQVVYDSARKTIRVLTDSGSFDLPEAAAKPITEKIMARVREQGRSS
jgi:uncharacterized peroxidase-related enzyme